MALMADRAAMVRTLGFFRNSSSLIRSFCASATSASPNAASTSVTKKPKHREKKNLFEVARYLPNWGLGYQMAKSHWVGVTYQITKINLYKDGCHGKAWGIVHKDDKPAADAPKKISGVHKRCWRYIPNSKKAIESQPILEVQAT